MSGGMDLADLGSKEAIEGKGSGNTNWSRAWGWEGKPQEGRTVGCRMQVVVGVRVRARTAWGLCINPVTWYPRIRGRRGRQRNWKHWQKGRTDLLGATGRELSLEAWV